MYRPRDRQATERRGIVLLVVLALLTLFAIVGISFVLYANSEANASRYFREGEAPPQPDMDPEQLLAYFLNQAIYDVDDERPGAANPNVYSALRGHSLARSMYGYNTDLNNNNVSFNGIGRLHETTTPPLFNPPPVGNLRDDFNFINYIPFRRPDGALTDGKRHDPERPGWRADNAARLPFVGGFNAPYTYPDLNNMFLAAVRADGTVLAPSFHRPWLFGTWTPGQEATSNQNWTNSYGKYLLLRPRPQEMGAGFPYPEDLGGDVKNLIGSPGTLLANGSYANNDSFWMDLGHPVMIAPDGTKYKPLFAPLIVDLDNRINLNVHGNDRGKHPDVAHCSNQGWGPWEVDISKVLNYPGTPADYWSNIFTGNTTGPSERGRFNPDGTPTTSFPPTNIAAPGTPPHCYAPVDYDGCQLFSPGVRTPSDPLAAFFIQPTLSMLDNTWTLPSCPLRPAGYQDGNNVERQDHPLLYNFFNPQRNGNRSDLAFPISNMEALLRYGETNSAGLTSSLYRLTGKDFGEIPAPNQIEAARRRGMVTTHSFGLGRVGVSPWFWNAPDGPDPTSSTLTMDKIVLPNTPNNLSYPQAHKPIPFPPLSLRTTGLPLAAQSDFTADWRCINGALAKIDLNRELTPYPIRKRTPNTAYHPVTNPLLPLALMTPQDQAQFARADTDRVAFARDIYGVLMVATGAFNPFTYRQVDPPPTTPQLVALRWLAQLAVNIVDFIDTDDIMTAFPWAAYGSGAFTQYMNNSVINHDPEFPTAYVFGTELPRVVLNEVYSQYRRVNTNLTTPSQYDIDVWVELYNPMLQPAETDTRIRGDSEDDPTSNYLPLQTPQNAILQMPNPVGSVYQVVLTENVGTGAQKLRETRNVTGSLPSPLRVMQIPITGRDCKIGGPPGSAADFNSTMDTTTQFIAPSGGHFQAPISPGTAPAPINQGFYVLGPLAAAQGGHDFPKGTAPAPADRYLSPASYVQRAQMTYRTFGSYLQWNQVTQQDKASILLRRLACPYKPEAVDNPYITVDTWGGILQPDDSTTAVATHHSYGRQQPYWANSPGLPMKATVPAGEQNVDQPQHTFFRQNASYNDPNRLQNIQNDDPTLRSPFNWLTHLDRQLISPMELLLVSGYRPHELLQQFYIPPTGNFSHYAHWFDPRTRLYRVFEFLETNNRAAGVARGGRIPGLVNLNTVWDSEILQALCAANSANNFTDAQVAAMFNQMKNLRTASANGVPGPGDRPFLGMAAAHSSLDSGAVIPGDPQHPLQGVGIMDTLLRSVNQTPNPNPSIEEQAQRAFGLTPIPFNQGQGNHAYTNFQLLNKLFNNVTTRSNVFGVWVTVGFFKVTDENARPVKLGAEIGKTENRNVRHRMFAIVDRTNITTATANGSNQPGGPPIFLTGRVIGTENYGGANHSIVTVAGAKFQPDPSYTPAQTQETLVGFYEALPWKIHGTDVTPPVPNRTLSTNVDIDYGERLLPQGGRQSRIVSAKVDKVVYNPADGLPPRIVLNVDLNNIPDMNNTVSSNPTTVLMQIPYGPPGIGQNGLLGNPGPQLRFNPRSYPWLVRYFSIIQ